MLSGTLLTYGSRSNQHCATDESPEGEYWESTYVPSSVRCSELTRVVFLKVFVKYTVELELRAKIRMCPSGMNRDVRASRALGWGKLSVVLEARQRVHRV